MPTVDEVIAARVRADIAEKMLEMLQAQLAEMTAQRDRWEQRFDQLILSTLNAGDRRPWWRRIRETTVDNRAPLSACQISRRPNRLLTLGVIGDLVVHRLDHLSR
jgi:hypothetical protein